MKQSDISTALFGYGEPPSYRRFTDFREVVCNEDALDVSKITRRLSGCDGNHGNGYSPKQPLTNRTHQPMLKTAAAVSSRHNQICLRLIERTQNLTIDFTEPDFY